MSLNQINVNNTLVTSVDEEPIIGSDNLLKSGGVGTKFDIIGKDYIKVTLGYYICPINTDLSVIGTDMYYEAYKTCYYSELLNIPKKTCIFKNLWHLREDQAQFASLFFLDNKLKYVGRRQTLTGIYTFDPVQETIPDGARWIVLCGQVSGGLSDDNPNLVNRYFEIERTDYEQLTTGIMPEFIIDHKKSYLFQGSPRSYSFNPAEMSSDTSNILYNNISFLITDSNGTYTHFGNFHLDSDEYAALIGHKSGDQLSTWTRLASFRVRNTLLQGVSNFDGETETKMGISTSLFIKNALFYINALGAITKYYKGYISNDGTLHFYNPVGYYFALFRCIPGHIYKYYKYKDAGDEVGAWNLYKEDLTPVHQSTTQGEYYYNASYGPTERWYDIKVPAEETEAAFIGVTISWKTDNDNFKNFILLDENDYVANFDTLMSKNSINKGYVNLVNIPFTLENVDLSEYNKTSLILPCQETSGEMFVNPEDVSMVKVNGFNLRTISYTVDSIQNYVSGHGVKIYASQFNDSDWDENGLMWVNIYTYLYLIKNGVTHNHNEQFFVEVYYGVTPEYIKSIKRWFLSSSYNRIFYNSGTFVTKEELVTNNPGKNFDSKISKYSNKTYSGWRHRDYPIYKTLLDENGNELPFSGIVVNICDTGANYSAEGNHYEVLNSTIVVCKGESSIDYYENNNETWSFNGNHLPYSKLDTNVLKSELLNGNNKIHDNLIPDSIVRDEEIFDSNNQIKDELLPSESSVKITLQNSEKMAFYGCSFTESYYAVKNKSWVNKLSNLLDLPALNFGVSGNRIVDLSYRLRANSNPYGGVGIRELKPTYIVIQNIGNETLHMASGATLELYLQQIREMVEDIKALGATPVFGTDWCIDNKSVDVQLKEFADELGILYCPIGTICEKSCEQKYAGFWGGGHPASRTNEATTEEWYHQLKNLHVRQSIKIFRVRDEFAENVHGISDLNYDSLVQRLRKYIEINCGEKSLNESDNSWKRYDSLAPVDYTAQNNSDEYTVMMYGYTIAFTNYALIEFIAPRVKCKSKITIPCATAGLKFYMKNANNPVSPYPTDRINGAFYVTKAVWNAFDASVGDKFTSNASGSAQITYAGKVKGQEYGGYILLFDSANTLSGGAGNLVNVATSAQTAYLRCEYNLSRYDYGFFNTLNKPVSNFEEVTATYVDGLYTIELNDYKYWEYDKMRIIIQKSGSFSLGAPTCVVIGGENKVDKVTKVLPKQSGDTELCEQTGFGASEYNNVWDKEDGIVFEKMPDSIKDYPQYTTNDSHVVLTQKDPGFSNKISKTFTIPTSRGYRKMYVRVSSRLFPKIYNQTTDDNYHTTTRLITPTSNDYGRLELAVNVTGNNNPTAICEAFVGCGWAEKFFEFIIPPFVTSVKIELYRNPHDFDETEKLARNWPMQVCDISVSMHNM